MDLLLLSDIYQDSLNHRAEHKCGSYPYAHGDVLTALITANLPQRILELGTGLGYSTACLAAGNPNALIDTIDQDDTHLTSARKYWEMLNVQHKITTHFGKAEAILPELSIEYDFIFFDGYAPSLKFLNHFERLLRVGGLLVTANLYLKDPRGGKYVRTISNRNNWESVFFSDSAVSLKLK